MKLLPFLFLAPALLPSAVLAKKAPDAYPVTYAGGSLPLHHNKIRASLGKDEVVFMQHGQRISIPAKSITEISCRADVRRRAGAWALDVVPLMHLGESGTYYIGVSWSGTQQVLLKLSRAEYGGFLAALEQLTGIKAVDTNQVPTVVRYAG